MLLSRSNGATSNVIRVKIRDSSVTTGAGLTGLTSASSGLIISTIADNEATATTYTVAGSTIETITTLGTFAAPTATKVRFKEVDATNHKGVYELHIADARLAVSGAKHLLVSLLGVTNMVQTDVIIDQLAGANVTHNAGTAITSASGRQEVNTTHIAGSSVSTSTAQLGVNVVNFGGSAATTSSGRPEVNTTHIAGSAVSASTAQLGVNVVNFGGSAGTFSSGIPSVNTVQWRGTQPATLSNTFVQSSLQETASGIITATSIAADAIGASELATDAVTEIVNAVKAAVVESNGSITLQQAISVILSAVAGVTTSSGNTLKDPSGTSTRIAATTNGSNERTAITLTPSS